MSIKELVTEIEDDVHDMRGTSFVYSDTNAVPSRNDSVLTFANGEAKKGKTLNSCVLYVDIRNSVELGKKHHRQTMGRIYSIFSKSMLKIAKYYSGSVRNIIGDRVMIVFPAENCYTNAVNCAISINHVNKFLINKTFTDVDFKCGIGIDYGELKVSKVGIVRRGEENIENKNLVWVGHPANVASRLTDVACKTIVNNKVKVTYNKKQYHQPGLGEYYGFDSPNLKPEYSPLGEVRNLEHLLFGQFFREKKVYYIESTQLHDLADFTKCLSCNADGCVSYSGGELVKFEKIEDKIQYPSILMTEKVFIGFKVKNPERKSIKNSWWEEVSNDGIQDINTKVYGGDISWEI